MIGRRESIAGASGRVQSRKRNEETKFGHEIDEKE